MNNINLDLSDLAPDDLLVSFELLALDLQKIAQDAGEGDPARMRDAAQKLRAWRGRFDVRLAEMEGAVSEFGALDSLMGEEQEEEQQEEERR